MTVRSADLEALVTFCNGARLCVLSGAGISTDSGIPDYRGPASQGRVRRPIQHMEFVTRPLLRARYWARSGVAWPRFRAFAPNAAHHSLARLQASGAVTGLITQNVDRLHHKAGSVDVIELHGALHEVRCLACGQREDRDALQTRLVALNPWLLDTAHTPAPDGDADLSDEAVARFVVAGCLACDGVLKPDVVFFGDNVPKERVDRAFASLDGADALLVVGSSLTVYSGYRFVLRAAARHQPVAIVNLGETRGDPHATLKLDAPVGELLAALAERLTA